MYPIIETRGIGVYSSLECFDRRSRIIKAYFNLAEIIKSHYFLQDKGGNTHLTQLRIEGTDSYGVNSGLHLRNGDKMVIHIEFNGNNENETQYSYETIPPG